jgi:hypothetical protein
MSEKESAPFLEMPNEVAGNHYAKAHYGDRTLPHPRNVAAMKVDGAKVMRQVNEGK